MPIDGCAILATCNCRDDLALRPDHAQKYRAQVAHDRAAVHRLRGTQRQICRSPSRQGNAESRTRTPGAVRTPDANHARKRIFTLRFPALFPWLFRIPPHRPSPRRRLSNLAPLPKRAHPAPNQLVIIRYQYPHFGKGRLTRIGHRGLTSRVETGHRAFPGVATQDDAAQAIRRI